MAENRALALLRKRAHNRATTNMRDGKIKKAAPDGLPESRRKEKIMNTHTIHYPTTTQDLIAKWEKENAEQARESSNPTLPSPKDPPSPVSTPSMPKFRPQPRTPQPKLTTPEEEPGLFPLSTPPKTPFKADKPNPANDHPRRFDQKTYNQISGLDARLLEAIQYDCKMQRQYRKTGAKYSVKSEAYFAKILNVCRETISDSVCKLEDLGILDITRRRKIHGNFQTNLYRIKGWIWWRLGKMLRGLRKRQSRVTQTSHKPNCRTEKETEEPIKGAPLKTLTREILARWTARGFISPSPT